MANEQILDCKGLACPQPVIRTKEALEGMAAGEVLLVVVDNEGSCSNVQRFAASQGHLSSFSGQGDEYRIRVTKGSVASDQPEPEIVCEVGSPRGRMVVHINSDTVGRGDDTLGAILMKAYFETLLHFGRELSQITLVNSGVRLAVQGSPVLDHLQELNRLGVAVLACGTCLNHFGLKETLAVGEVSNMFTILEAQSRAARVLTP